jgi:hypothetical protein
MSDFLKDYEGANDTVIRFRKEFPSGRIFTHIDPTQSSLKDGYVTFIASVFREYEDQLPSATSTAYGNVALYPANMKKWFVEDTETSAVARAIKLLSPSANRPSREDMARVEYEATPSKDEDDLWATLTVKQTELETGTQSLGSVLTLVKEQVELAAPPQTPVCKHGHMLFKSGTSAKTGKPYEGYTCPSSNRDDQCKAVWL